MSEFNKEITYLLTDYSAMDSSTTNASLTRCVLIMRNTKIIKYIRVTWLRHALRHDALRTSVSNNFVPIR